MMVRQTKRPLMIVGAFHSRGADIADLASDIAEFAVEGFVEVEDRERCEQNLERLPIFWIEESRDLVDSHEFVYAGSAEHRQHAASLLQPYAISFATLILPSASVSRTVEIGIGSTIIDRVTLGSGCSVCTGAVVTKDVAEGVTVAGMPARVIRTDPAPPIY